MTTSTATGHCELCDSLIPEPQMAMHLKKCAPEHDSGSDAVPLALLRVDASHDATYWLYCEARSDTTFEQLDLLLRHVWLECCDHMSAFHVGRAEIAKRAALGTALSGGARFSYEYDFGSTTALVGRIVSERDGTRGRAALRVVARNLPIVWTCIVCKARATLVCPQCMWGGTDGWLCTKHAKNHPCADDIEPMPVVNSPRMGVCGYTG